MKVRVDNRTFEVRASAFTLILYEDNFKGRRMLQDLSALAEMEQNGAVVPGYTPSWHLFLIAACVALLTLIPIIGAYLYQKKHPETLYVSSEQEA